VTRAAGTVAAGGWESTRRQLLVAVAAAVLTMGIVVVINERRAGLPSSETCDEVDPGGVPDGPGGATDPSSFVAKDGTTNLLWKSHGYPARCPSLGIIAVRVMSTSSSSHWWRIIPRRSAS
jgi:hypothetical protein